MFGSSRFPALLAEKRQDKGSAISPYVEWKNPPKERWVFFCGGRTPLVRSLILPYMADKRAQLSTTKHSEFFLAAITIFPRFG
jgi:hypothetical protein